MGWEFPAALVAAMVLALILGYRQQKAYSGAVTRAAERYSGPNNALVTGRGKGWLSGAVVIMIVDQESRRVVHAEAMTGATVFARPRQAPELLGPVDSLVDRIGTGKKREAVEMAVQQFTRVQQTDKRRLNRG